MSGAIVAEAALRVPAMRLARDGAERYAVRVLGADVAGRTILCEVVSGGTSDPGRVGDK